MVDERTARLHHAGVETLTTSAGPKAKVGDPGIGAFAIMIGAMKAGTTSVFRYLRQHPQIAACSIKEPGFFNDDRCFARGLDWYQGLWDWNPAVHAWALEASTEYTHPAWSAKVAERLAALDADVRILYVVRDPIQRFESQYNHGYSAGWLPREISIDDAVDQRPNFIDRSRYAVQLEPYRERFGRDRILILNQSDLAADPLAEMNRVVSFLGIAPHVFENLSKVHNRGTGRIVESPVIARMRRSRWLFDGLQRFVPRGVQDVVRGALGGRLTEPFRLSPESRSRVVGLLATDLERLRVEYDVDISAWELCARRVEHEE